MFSTAPRDLTKKPQTSTAITAKKSHQSKKPPSSSASSRFKLSVSGSTTPATSATSSSPRTTLSQQKNIARAAEPKMVPPTLKISNRCAPKAILDLGQAAHKTAFSSAYSKGAFPCRLEHGSVKHKIFWAQPIATISYNPLFLTLLDGLRETVHPFLFLVPNALKQLISHPTSKPKLTPLLSNATPPLRLALSSKHPSTILNSLEVVKELVKVVGPELLPFLSSILPPIALHSHSRDARVREAVTECLQAVEEGIAYGGMKADGDVDCGQVEVNVGVGSTGGSEKKVVNVGEWIGVGGGEKGVGGVQGAEALRIIKSKIPTYSSVFG